MTFGNKELNELTRNLNDCLNNYNPAQDVDLETLEKVFKSIQDKDQLSIFLYGYALGKYQFKKRE